MTQFTESATMTEETSTKEVKQNDDLDQSCWDKSEVVNVATVQAVDNQSGFHTDTYNEFDYKPVPVIAVVGLVLAFVSSMGIFVWLAMPLCVVAFCFSVASVVVITRSKGAYGGKGVAYTGVLLSVLFFSAGMAQQIYTFRTEVPEGYERVSFIQDISKKGFIEKDGVTTIHPDVLALDGKKVFLKGYIYQTGKLRDLSSFLMVKDNQDCCFGANPALTDRVGVVMSDGKTIDYHAGKVAISGTFTLNPKYNPENELEPVYIVEGEIFSKWVSDFN